MWRLTRITRSGQTTATDANGNIIIKTDATNILMFVGEGRGLRTLVVYLTIRGRYVAYLGAETVTEKLEQERWRDIYATALGYNAMTGSVEGYPLQEIGI